MHFMESADLIGHSNIWLWQQLNVCNVTGPFLPSFVQDVASETTAIADKRSYGPLCTEAL